MFLLGHLGLTLLVARLWVPLMRAGERFPVGFLLLGALLPDLIDKPLGHALLGWANGRLWGHTLLFAAVLLGVTLVRSSRRWEALAVGTVCHQLLDRAWQDMTSWLWPMAGSFPREVSTGVPDWIAALASDPYLWATEAAGLLALLALLLAPWLGLSPRWWREPVAGETPQMGLEGDVPAGSRPDGEA